LVERIGFVEGSRRQARAGDRLGHLDRPAHPLGVLYVGGDRVQRRCGGLRPPEGTMK
jgi:hypothetical protein